MTRSKTWNRRFVCKCLARFPLCETIGPSIWVALNSGVFWRPLALDAGQTVSGDRLVDRVWGDGALPEDPFPHDTDFRQVAVASEAQLLGTATGKGAIIWDVNIDHWVEIACRAAGRNLSSQEWLDFGPNTSPRATCPTWPLIN
jgi:hypothetical protein